MQGPSVVDDERHAGFSRTVLDRVRDALAKVLRHQTCERISRRHNHRIEPKTLLGDRMSKKRCSPHASDEYPLLKSVADDSRDFI